MFQSCNFGKRMLSLLCMGLFGVIISHGMSTQKYEELLQLGANGFRQKYGIESRKNARKSVVFKSASKTSEHNSSDSKKQAAARHFMPSMFEM